VMSRYGEASELARCSHIKIQIKRYENE